MSGGDKSMMKDDGMKKDGMAGDKATMPEKR
jgi:hypothetical protein